MQEIEAKLTFESNIFKYYTLCVESIQIKEFNFRMTPTSAKDIIILFAVLTYTTHNSTHYCFVFSRCALMKSFYRHSY